MFKLTTIENYNRTNQSFLTPNYVYSQIDVVNNLLKIFYLKFVKI